MGTLNVKVVPSSSRDQLVGWLGGAMKIKVMAPPEKGRANAAVVDFLARRLGVDKKSIEVISGHSSPAKIVQIGGLDDDQLATLLNQCLLSSK
jgi:uncharacterized protein